MSAIRVLTLSGSPFEMGYAHGLAYKDEIAALTEERLSLSSDPYWSGRAAPHTEIMALGRLCLEHHESFSPELMEELRGIAEATGIGLVELLIMNGFTDFIDAVYNGIDDDPGGCTAFLVSSAISADERNYLGQTWDMHPTATPHILLLDIKPQNGPASLNFTLTGCVGMIGMNEHGIAVGINNLRATDGRPGVTWPFVVRKMLAQDNVQSALEVLLSTQLAGAHNYLLLGPQGQGYNIEASSTRNLVTPLKDYFVHTNHCLSSELTPNERPKSPPAWKSTSNRLQQADTLLARHKGKITPQTLMDLTRYRDGERFSICTYASPEYKVESSGACIMSPVSREFWAVWGIPDQNEYQRFQVAGAKLKV